MLFVPQRPSIAEGKDYPLKMNSSCRWKGFQPFSVLVKRLHSLFSIDRMNKFSLHSKVFHRFSSLQVKNSFGTFPSFENRHAVIVMGAYRRVVLHSQWPIISSRLNRASNEQCSWCKMGLSIIEDILRLHREFRCGTGCCWCSYWDNCQQVVTVESPPGQIIGTVTQQWTMRILFIEKTRLLWWFVRGSIWRACYELKDQHESTTLTIVGPRCICNGSCCENKFTVSIQFCFQGECIVIKWLSFSR